MSIQKAKSSVHVTIATTPLLSSGGARSSPPKGGTAYRGTVAPSTGYPIFLQLSMPSAGICRYGGSWAACAARFEKGIFHALIGHFPGLPGLALPLAPPGACVAVCSFPHMRKARFCRGPPSVPASPRRKEFREGGHSFAMRPRQQAPAVGIAQSLARLFPGAFRWIFPAKLRVFSAREALVFSRLFYHASGSIKTCRGYFLCPLTII